MDRDIELSGEFADCQHIGHIWTR